ncbi:hypothetical protein D3C83_56770 [compost metagenome]
MHELGFAGFLVTEADLRPAGLEGLEIGAAGDLQPALLAGGPDLEVVFLRLGEAEVAAAHQQHPVRQLELLQQALRIGAELLQLVVAA